MWMIKVQFEAGFTKTIEDDSLASAILSVARLVHSRAESTQPTGIEVTKPKEEAKV